MKNHFLNLIFVLFFSFSFSQIATYPLSENLNDTTNSFHGSYNPFSCCDIGEYDNSICQERSEQQGFDVCNLNKVISSENFTTKNNQKFLKLEKFNYFSLPKSLNASIKEDKSLEISFKIYVPSDGDWGYQSGGDADYYRTIFSMGNFDQAANGFTVNLSKESEDGNDRLRIRVFAGGKENELDDVAGQIMDVKFIDFDTVVDFSMVINIDSAAAGITFNVDGERSFHIFDDDSILTGSEGGDIRVTAFKKALKANQIKVGTDNRLSYNEYDGDLHGGTFLINDLKIFSPKKPGDINILKNVLTLFKDHINGTSTLSDSEKAENLIKFFDNWDDNHEPVFDEIKSFVDAYATANGPIFEDMEPVNPNTFNEETTIQVELQNSLHNNYFTKENINKDSFVNFIYDDADVWPGPVSASAPRLKPTVTIDATYNTDPGYVNNGQNTVYRMTGYYAAPGEYVSLKVNSSAINSNLIVEIGTSTFPLGTGTRNRFQNVVKSFKITSQEFKIASPFGGPIYIRVPDKTNLGNIDITLDNVVKMPFFSIKTGSETSLSEYKEELAKGHVKWVDWESDNFLTTVTLPMANYVEEEVGDPTSLMSKWSDTFQVFQDVSGRPSKRIRAEYIRFDRMNPVGGTWAGASYPMYLYGKDPNDPDDAYANTHVINVGFQTSDIYAQGETGLDGEHFIILHEMGHLHNMPTLPDEVESNVNFPAVAVYNLVFNETIDDSFVYSLQQRLNREEAMMDWFISPNFRIGNGMHHEDRGFDLGAPDFTGNEMMYQNRGHGKYVELGALFGWESVGKINKFYYDEGLPTIFPDTKSHDVTRDDFIINASETLGINLSPLFDIWGTVPEEKSTIRELSILESSNELASSNLIKERIINYRSIVPRNKSEFVNYWNKLFEAGKNQDGNKQRWQAMAGSGYGDYPEYSEKIANEIIAQIDLILCRYYNSNCISDDLDEDGIINTEDNCPETPNSDQADADGDGIGDVCEIGWNNDEDNDNINDYLDNCIYNFNPGQEDADGDGIGDVCDEDIDGDGILNDIDNCEKTANEDQADMDGDGIGDVCDDDIDGDGWENNVDNCEKTANEDQSDMDGDGIGDVCDENDDKDGDGILNEDDNCPDTANEDQSDIDGDGIGDVCDDGDEDGIYDDIDNCPDTANKDQADMDGDGIGDVCDDDKDGDTILNANDNCPEAANEDQADMDSDGLGDVCDDDKDGDTILNSNDNCPETANEDQADMDGDGIGDVCDDDKDGDTILNTDDNCPKTANEDQADMDGDGIGDVCDDDVDGDGILNTDDNCPETPLDVTVDVNGCEIFTLPLDNNKVSVTSASCIGNTDGSIGLSIEDNSYNYSVNVTGKDDPISLGGETKTASVTGLGTGTYTVCFKVDGQDTYEQCFEVNIGEPKALSVFIDVDNDNRTTSIQLSGSSTYNVEVNGERYDVKGDRFTTILPSGLSIIKISTDLDCQGVIEREIFISEDILYYPNPTPGDVNVYVNGEDSKVTMSVFSSKGDLIFTKEQEIQSTRKTDLDLGGVPAGTYLVTLEGPTVRKTFKIVKR